MLPKKTRHLWYALLVVGISFVSASAFEYSPLYHLVEAVESLSDKAETQSDTTADAISIVSPTKADVAAAEAAPMFSTIILNADEQVTCSDNGFTIARFNLCGDFDDRLISLSGSFSSYEWQQLVPSGSCTFDVNDDCPPIIGNECNSSWQTVGTSASYTVSAGTIPPTTGAEFRVRANGGTYYYFKVKKSSITQTYIKRDFICGVPGRIQLTNLSSAYEYSIDNGSGFGPWQNSAIFDGLTPGTYLVKTRLRNTANTCEYPYEPIVIEDRIIDLDVTFTDATCFGDTGTITVNVNNVPGPYRYTLLDQNGVPQEFTTFIPNNPYTFAAVGQGTYSVQVETQQCAGDPTLGILPPQESLDVNGNPIIIGDGLVALAASTEVNESLSTDPACGANDADIIVRTSGGVPPYTFTVSDGGNSGGTYVGQTTYNVTTAGSYQFTITDANGCLITASASVQELSPPDVTASGTDGDCNNGARIDINVLDAKGYDLSFRAQPVDPWSANPVLTVGDGTYNSIQVRYESGSFSCIYTLPTSLTLTNVGAITGNAVKLQDRVCNASGGTDGGIIEFQGPFSGGSGSGYEFSIDGVNFSTQLTYSNLAPGTYTPIIRDTGGCRLQLTAIDILDADPPTDIDFAQGIINCAAGTSDVQLTGTSNAAIVQYEIVSPITLDNGASDTFPGLSVNTAYTFRITDANGCFYEESFTPALLNSIGVRLSSGGDLRVCTGATDGSGTFIVDGFLNGFTYSINGGPTSPVQNTPQVTLPPSGAGTYTIVVTDADTGCTDSSSLQIEEPSSPLTLSGNVTAMTCSNGNRGRVTSIASGGWGSYRYSLEQPNGSTRGPKSGRTFGNLTQSGTYILTVTDSEGCTDSFSFDLTPVSSPNIALDGPSSDFCFVPGIGATLAVTSTAGSAPVGSHRYRINGGALQVSPVFSGLSPGNYRIQVVDSNNCEDEINVTVNPQLRVTGSIETEIPCGGADGSLRVQVSGGYTTGAGAKQYEISADNGSTFGPPIPLTSNSFLFDTNTPGDYVFRVTDNQGCISESVPVTLNPPIPLDPASASVIPASCGQTNNGILTVVPDATSGIPPFLVSFEGGAFGSQTVFSNLNAGQTYTYAVRDAIGCETAPATVTIPNDPTLPPDATVNPVTAVCLTGVLEGSIDITSVSDGTPDFTYILQDQFGTEISRIGPTSSTSESFSNLAPDTYRIVTLDANGCRDEDLVTIDQTTLDVVPDPVLAPVCDPSGFTNTVEIVGGTGPFLIRLAIDPNPPVTPNSPPRRHTFTGLQFGVAYEVEVTDQGTGCVYLDEIAPVAGPTPLDITATSTPDFCDLSRNGQIVYNIDGFAASSDLLIELLNTDNGTRITIENPTNVSPIYSNTYETPAGNYQIIATDLTNNCTDAAAVTVDQNLPAFDIVASSPANCNAFGQLTVQGTGGSGGPYVFAYMDAGVSPTPGDWTLETTFVAPAGTYDIYVRDVANCASFAIQTIIGLNPDLVPPTFLVENGCDITATTFDILVQMPGTVDTPRFSLNGDEQFPVLNGGFWEYTYTVGSPGDYIVDVVDASGCASQGTATVYEFLNASGDFTTDPSCNNTDGVITISTNGGSGDFTFELRDGSGAYIADNTTGVFTGYAPGDYEVLVTDNLVIDLTGNCTFLVDDITMPAANEPVIATILDTDISCNGADDGSIEVILQPGTDLDSPLVYTLFVNGTATVVDQNGAGSFSNLPPGVYDVTVVSNRGCEVRQDNIDIVEPPVFSISASAPPFSCVPGANQFSSTIITVSVVDPGTASGGYQYSITGFENYQSANTFEIIDNGAPQTITVYAIDGNGCQDQVTLPVINPPSNVIPSLSVMDVLTCTDPEQVRIDVAGTTDFTVSLVNGPAAVTPVTNTPGNSFVLVDLPAAGGYLLQVTDNIEGCSYPLPLHQVSDPLYPDVVIREANPVRCAVPGDDGALFIEVSDYSGVYNYDAFLIDTSGNRILPAAASGSFDTANFPDASGDPARITGLSGGNYVVEISTISAPGCPGISNLATVRAPNGPLVPIASSEGNVSCTDNTGIINAASSGGWDTSPYQFRLLRDNGTGTYVEVVPLSAQSRFENLSSGNYRVEVEDIEGCTEFTDITLDPVPPILVGIREPQGLICPGGNNAVLEAFDPATGDETTAVAGASGGVTGAGFIYQLIYLGSNDINDELSRSGLQSSPTFIGANGFGYLSAGWYAIEVSSSFDCLGVTTPYYVDPPPAIVPTLLQVQAPGCGGFGEMRLTVTNPEVGFNYEYRPVGVPPTDPFISMGAGVNSVLIQGLPGFYQFEVRKVNATNACDVVTSNGLTLIDAQDLDLVVNLPDDISCATELDGRIESFAGGGVGNNSFFLYRGDPGDPFSPNPGAVVVRGPQPDGTFEGLSEGTDYYVAVISGSTCADVEGPLSIARPDPITYSISTTQISCAGETDGTATVEVTGGGQGLVQFAIEPNFNEFFTDAATPGAYTFTDLEGAPFPGREYDILIQDEQGCSEITTVRIIEPEPLDADFTTTPETCIGFADGTAQLTVSGGTPFTTPAGIRYYETSLNSADDADFVRNDNLFFDNLQGGESYVVFIRDANGCLTNVILPIDIGVELGAEAVVDYGCDGIFPFSTTRIEMQDDSVLDQVLFALDPVDPTDAITAMADLTRTWGDLPAGDHIVYIYHENGCTNFIEFTIEAYEPLTLDAMQTGPNEITATASGGYGGYEYFFQGESLGSTNVFYLNFDAMVNIRVRDREGCEISIDFPFDFTGMVDFPNFFTPDGDGMNDVWAPLNREFFPNIEVIIYDRYGRVVATLDQVTNWDGTYDSKELPSGDYWYVVNANDNEKQQYVGHFTLFR
ncbi:T9SS type B sorting domain-containing protein [Robiginitalea aurantiaca]|uniref:T9SS type B sorting domain-containing protein n=1 Tax=Robiginitalea aurantiaca TaxID=3056915 RepID=A0ABT7WGN6_9FLAO|nr:T9SS type B sorting domain-containing protein [Robiginitalea aurantiaca]MDM9632086.1 T9SS type B sorting domain-containing protein [Robiginitalea aurantiaca]